MADAMKKHPEVDVLINFASLRSAYDSTIETMNYAQVGQRALGWGSRESSCMVSTSTATWDKWLGTQDCPVVWEKVVGYT